MKKGALLFFVLAMPAISCPWVGAVERGEAFDVDKELRGKTFFIQELDRNQQGYHAYFQDDGILTIKFSAKHWKYERWQVDDKGTLCMTTIARKVGKTILYTSKCGRFFRDSSTAYRWYNGDGQHRANFSLKGQGELLPGTGLQAALDAETVLAKDLTIITARTVKKRMKRMIRPRAFKRRK